MSTVISAPPPNIPAQPKSWGNRIAILVAALLVLGPISFAAIPTEIARWHVAAAQEAQWSEDYDTALTQLDKAIEVDPENPVWWLRRASFQESHRQYQAALKDARETARLLNNSPGARMLVVSAALAAEEHEQAKKELASLEKFIQENPQYSGAMDNEVAYFKALLNEDLEDALARSNAAINRFKQDQPALQGVSLLLSQFFGSDSSKRDLGEASLIDTRGVIYWRMGKLPEARADLDQAIKLAEPLILENMSQLRENAVDTRQLKQMKREVSETLAVMRYHRSLVFEALGMKFEAALDRARVRDLGFTLDEKLF